MNFKSFVLLTVVSMLASPLCHAQVEVRPVGITINSVETLYNKTLDGATTVFNGSSTQNFVMASGSASVLNMSGVSAWIDGTTDYSSDSVATYSDYITENGTYLITVQMLRSDLPMNLVAMILYSCAKHANTMVYKRSRIIVDTEGAMLTIATDTHQINFTAGGQTYRRRIAISKIQSAAEWP